MIKKAILITIISLCTIYSYAQQATFGEHIDQTIELIDNNKFNEALELWRNRAIDYQGVGTTYAWGCVKVAESFKNLGKISETEQLLNEAEQTLNSIYDENDIEWHKIYAYTYTSKAHLYLMMHDIKRAKSSAIIAKDVYESCLFRGVDYAITLIRLAQAAMADGNRALARTVGGMAIYYAYAVLNQDASEENYAYFSLILREYAGIELELGNYQNAINTYLALKDGNKTVGLTDWRIDYTIGIAYLLNEDYISAIEYLENYYKRTNLDNVTKTVAGLYLLYSKYKAGCQNLVYLAEELSNLQVENTKDMFRFMSEQERNIWWMANEHKLLDFVNTIILNSSLVNANSIVANNSIFTKGLLLRTSNEVLRTIKKSGNSDLLSLYWDIEQIKSTLAICVNPQDRYRIETELAQKEKTLFSQLNIDITLPSWDIIANSLSNKEAAVEFIRLPDIGNISSDAYKYYAIIVKHGAKEPKIIPLFDEPDIISLIKNKNNNPTHRHIATLYSANSPTGTSIKLYNLIWSKLEAEVKSAKTVYYAPVGHLNSISFQALYDGKKYLGTKHEMKLMSSISHILDYKRQLEQPTESSVIFGGIEYDVEESVIINESRSYSRGESSKWEETFGETRMGWKNLPGTSIEADNIYICNNVSTRIVCETY